MPGNWIQNPCSRMVSAGRIYCFHYGMKQCRNALDWTWTDYFPPLPCFPTNTCSLIGTVLAAALFSNTLIIRSNPDIWWLDPFVAIICGSAALIYGFQSILVAWLRKKIPVCSFSWWFNLSSPSMPSSPTVQAEAEAEVMHGFAGASNLEMKENNSCGNEGTNLSAEVV